MIRYLPILVSVAGAAIIALTVGAALVEPSGDPSMQSQPQGPAQRAAQPQVDLTASAALFGVSEAKRAAVATAAPLPDLVLSGVLAAADPSDSQAMIQTADGIGFFRLGDVVAAGLALTDIQKDAVTLSDGARTHVLEFDVIAGAGAALAAATAARGPYRTAAHRAISAKLEKPETTAEYIEYWRERIRRNPGEVLDEIGLVPTERGYAIGQTQDIGVRLAGFRTGDLITAVNGRAVGNPGQDRKQIDAILEDGLAQITFERNGEERVLSFPLR